MSQAKKLVYDAIRELGEPTLRRIASVIQKSRSVIYGHLHGYTTNGTHVLGLIEMDLVGVRKEKRKYTRGASFNNVYSARTECGAGK